MDKLQDLLPSCTTEYWSDFLSYEAKERRTVTVPRVELVFLVEIFTISGVSGVSPTARDDDAFENTVAIAMVTNTVSIFFHLFVSIFLS